MTRIAIYADWDGLPAPARLGHLHARRTRANDVFEFEYDSGALINPLLNTIELAPRLGIYPGPQYPPKGRSTFGAFTDSSPDRWGRLLMNRRLERAQRAGEEPADKRLFESDYLLGVHDLYRVGALRFKLDDKGAFLDNSNDRAAPPLIQLRALQEASLALERDPDNVAAAGSDWLRMLIAPGGSLGGARPKATVVDPAGHLWIAKFPSANDTHDVGAWEMLVSSLGHACGLQFAAANIERFANESHCFRVQRFDRTDSGARLHFASAMTLTDHIDGDDASTGVSYLELANVLVRLGSQTDHDLRELWSRIVFNMLVSNADDHLRNHGFILEPGKGWRLSPAYDVNPDPTAHGLKLNVSEHDNALDLDLARSVAKYFRLKLSDADEIIESFRFAVNQWRVIAARLGIPAREQTRMAKAFQLAE
jgi:serine/threonine-protein kinase HipA